MGVVANFKALATDDRFLQDTKDIIVNKLFHQNTSDFFTIVPNIKGGQQVAAMKGFEYITKASSGCGGNGISPTFPAFSQKWNPKLQEVKIEICYTEFLGTFMQWKLNNGYDIKDLTGTSIALFIQDLVADAMAKDLLRMVLMSDKDIAAQDILTDEATMVPFYSTIDKGLIPTLQYLKTLPEFVDQFTTIADNTGLQAAQYALDPTTALDIYEEVTDVYDFEGDTLLTSNRLFKNYSKWVKRANGFGLQSNVDLTQKGVKDLQVDGNQIKPIVKYDQWKAKDFLTAGSVHLPHFAMYTKKEYLQVGVDSEASLTDITLEYVGGKDESFWIKANYMLDFKMVNPYAFKAAL